MAQLFRLSIKNFPSLFQKKKNILFEVAFKIWM